MSLMDEFKKTIADRDKRIAELERRLKILYANANGRMKEQCKDWFHEDGSAK